MRQRINISEESNQRILWYENHHINYEVMKSYYPKFYDRIKEMQAILFAEGYMLDEVEMATEIILNNMFIVHMNESSVSALERFLSITPLSYQTLDDRKNVLLSHFRGNGSVSMSTLTSLVDTVCGGKCEGELFTIDEKKNRGIRLKITLSDMRGNIENVISTIRLHIPAHLLFEVVYDPAKLDLTLYEKLSSSTSIENYISTAGERTEHIQNSSVAAVNSSTSVENVIIAMMIILDCGDFTEHTEDIIDGGDFSASSADILDFNY